MFALYMFGGEIERLLGSRRFLVYYLACVVGAAVAQLVVVSNVTMPPSRRSGPRAACSACCSRSAWPFPQRRIMLLFPPIPMPAWLFVTLYGLLELYLGVTGLRPGRGAFRPPGRHGRRLRTAGVLAPPGAPATAEQETPAWPRIRNRPVAETRRI